MLVLYYIGSIFNTTQVYNLGMYTLLAEGSIHLL
jgi:hypothetical protein